MANLGFKQFQYPMQPNMNFGQNRQSPFYNRPYSPDQDEEAQYAPQAPQAPQTPQVNMGGNTQPMSKAMFGSIPIQRNPIIEQFLQQYRQQMMPNNGRQSPLAWLNRGNNVNNLAPNGIRNNLFKMFNRR
jgi:hypothetical protein